MKRKKMIPLLLPASVAVILLIWSGWITWTSFEDGALPVVGWHTESRHLFGTIWLIALLTILLPIYFFGISLGLTAFLDSDQETAAKPKACWRVAWGMTIVLVLITFVTRLAVTAWFPTHMHPPFQSMEGGVLPGSVVTTVLFCLLVIFYRLMQRLSH